MTTTPAYYGDNGAHEFWETEDRRLILRNHGETWWTMIDETRGGCLGSRRYARNAAKLLGIHLDTSRRWTGPCGHMRLIAA